MATFTAKDVQELRQRTGAGMMDCKKALEENNGDLQAASDYLRKKGIAKAEKRARILAAARALMPVEGLDEPLLPATPLVLVDGADDEPEWQERALCAQTDPEAFFPEKGGSTREAKRVCTGCDVRSECLEYALEHDERFGIWGGLSERERRKLRRRAV